MNTRESLKEQVESTRKRYEGLDTVSNLDDPLDAEYRVRHDGGINEIVLCVTSGGPSVRVYLSKGIVKGTYGSERFTSHINDESLLEELFEYHRSLFERTLQKE